MSTTPQTDKMTLPPIIVTAHAAPGDMAYFDQMRRKHFPPHRNFLNAHITLFHHLPGRVFGEASSLAQEVVAQTMPFTAEVSGVRHLGGGVAFEIRSLELETLRANLFKAFGSWPGPQDRQKFKPHITVQNKVEKASADTLYERCVQALNRAISRSLELTCGTILVDHGDTARFLPFPQ